MKYAMAYAQVRALKPCKSSLKRAEQLLGDRWTREGVAIGFAEAAKAGVLLDDMVWLASALACRDKDADRRLRLWMADCAAHVLHIYEEREPSGAPRNAIITARQFARGEIDVASWDAASAASSAASWAASWAAARAAARAASWDAASAASWDSARAAARDAARAASWDAEAAWQYDRLVLWFSDDEPEDWPLPERGA